ncbi:YbhN family protein [Pseudonocardia sp. 73-21]|uniref:lysylphosphatidylglycerol synthase transmembrane domain-containing protein n=2 Tax=unclassified Pseudonocardia TaxID=2619320 RepID=UPI00095DB65C|nr:YbhN family protein [Pseudonocardia sp. 73-21]OJY53979.1 MAG: hypothetical protein BGP03_19690 [Pseudonocardia sp. 73-21]
MTGRRWVRRGVALAVLAVVVEYGVLPLVGDVDGVLTAARGVALWWFVPGVVLEAVSIAAYAAYTRALLPVAVRPRFSRLVRIDLATWGAGHVIPGGPAGTAALRFRLLSADGVDAADAALLAGVQGVLSAMVLHVILWGALVAAIVVHGPGGRLVALCVVLGVVAVVDVVLVTVAAARGGGRGTRLLHRIAARVPGLDAERVDRRTQEIVRRLHHITRDRRQLGVAVGWAAANWLLDAAALEMFLLALGHPVGVAGLLVAYGLANTLGVLPITPGGIGVVEGVLVPALVAFGGPAAPALIAVLGWRVVSFWLPIPAGGLSYLSLRVPRRTTGPDGPPPGGPGPRRRAGRGDQGRDVRAGR